MTVGRRCFLFEEDGTLRHVSQRVIEGLLRGTDSLPQYAGQRLKALSVYLALDESKRPLRITHHYAEIWHFDEDGSPKQSWAAGATRALEFSDQMRLSPPAPGPVVSIARKLERERWRREYRWEPTSTDITRVVHAVWPETAARPITRPKSVMGVSKRKKPMSYAAKHALDQCFTPTYQITRQIDELEDKDLKAFVDGARERADDPLELVGNELWKGIIAAAEKRLEIRRIRRAGKGKWFAAVEKMVSEPEPSHMAECITLEYQECDGKEAAIAAARELLAKHAHEFDELVEVEARVYPEIEWSGPSIPNERSAGAK